MTTDNDNLPEDDKLSALYKQAGDEQPPKHLDDAILAAARHETDSRPHPAYSPFSSNWRVPVSLAAVLVLSISIVNIMKDDEALVDDGIPLNGIAMEQPEQDRRNDAPRKTGRQGIVAEEARQPSTGKQRPAAPARERKKAEKGLTMGLASKSKPAAAVKPEPDSTRNSDKADDSTDEALLSQEPTAADRNMPATPAPPAEEARIIPTVEFITQLRKAGKTEEANRAADVFLDHYFGDDQDKSKRQQASLPVRELVAMIIELRNLGRKEDADRLDKLLRGRRSDPVR